MDIITHGTPQWESTALRFTCGSCGCVFDAEEGEYRKTRDQRGYSCYCPECGTLATEYCKKQGNRVLNKSGMDFGGIRTGNCPHCGSRVDDYKDYRRCSYCGQELIW